MPGSAQGRALQQDLLGGGTLHNPESRGLRQDVKDVKQQSEASQRGCSGFYTTRDSKMTHVVTSHHIRHLPEVRDYAFDVMHRATSVGGKLPTNAFRPITAKPRTGWDHNQGQQFFWCIKVTGQFRNTITLSPRLMPENLNIKYSTS